MTANKHLCSCNIPLEFDITMAFQPIVDIDTKQVYSYEALVRGVNGEGAVDILGRVNDENKYTFDQRCRVTAIELFSRFDVASNLNINFMPQAIYEPVACLAKTLQAAKKHNFPISRIIFEVTEHEKVVSTEFLVNVFEAYREKGFKTAIDDFGEGFAGLNLLSGFQPDLIKLDMTLIRDIDTNPAKQAIFKGLKLTADMLNIQLLAEGVETKEEFLFLKQNNIKLMQGYYIAKPAIEALPAIDWDTL